MLATDKQPYRLKSYAYGQWMLGEGEGKALADAATGRSVALIDSSGIEFAAMLDYARNQGGPALRSMSFHHRALMLKALGQALMAEKEAFYALSTEPRVPIAGLISKAGFPRCSLTPPEGAGSCPIHGC